MGFVRWFWWIWDKPVGFSNKWEFSWINYQPQLVSRDFWSINSRESSWVMTMAHEGVFPDSPRLAFQVANWFSGHDACICLSGTGSIWGGNSYHLHWPWKWTSHYTPWSKYMAQSPKGWWIQGLYKPIQGNCAIYFYPGVGKSIIPIKHLELVDWSSSSCPPHGLREECLSCWPFLVALWAIDWFATLPNFGRKLKENWYLLCFYIECWNKPHSRKEQNSPNQNT